MSRRPDVRGEGCLVTIEEPAKPIGREEGSAGEHEQSCSGGPMSAPFQSSRWSFPSSESRRFDPRCRVTEDLVRVADTGEITQTLEAADRHPQFACSRDDHLAKPGERHVVAGGDHTACFEERQRCGEAGKKGEVVVLDPLDQGTDRARAPVNRGHRFGDSRVEVVGPDGLLLQAAALEVLEDLTSYPSSAFTKPPSRSALGRGTGASPAASAAWSGSSDVVASVEGTRRDSLTNARLPSWQVAT